MKKFAIAAIAILVIAGLSLPPVFGIIVQNQVTERFANGGPNPYLKVRIDNFDRGLYTSTAILTVRPTDDYLAVLKNTISSSLPAADQTDGQKKIMDDLLAALSDGISIDIHYTHGPLTIQNGPFVGLTQLKTRVDSNTEFLIELQEKLELPYLIAIRANIDFDGSATLWADIPPFSASESDGGLDLDFSGLNMSGRYSAADDSVVGNAGIKLITSNTDEMNFSIEDISMTMDAIMLNDYIWLGDGNLLISHIEGTHSDNPNEPMLKVENVGIDTTMTVNDTGDQVSINLTYKLGQLTGIEASTIEDAQLKIGLSGIDIRALEKYAELVENMGLIDEQAIEESMPELMDIMHDVLAGSPSLTVDPFAFKLDGEAFQATLNIDVDGSTLPPLAQLTSTDPMIWSRALSGSARINATNSLANTIAENIILGQIRSGLPPESDIPDEQIQAMAKQQGQMMLESLIQQRMFIRETDKITSAIDFANGQLSVNDQAIPLGPPAAGQVP